MGSVSQQGRGSPLYALGSVISYAFFFLLNLVFIKVMKTFLKGYCCCGKIRVEMCQEHFLHIQNFYLLSYPVFPCDPFSLLGSSFAEQFLIFFSVPYCQHPSVFPRHHLFSSSCLWNNLYTLIRIFPLSLCPTIPSSHSDFPGSSFWAGTVCSLRYLTPLAVPCTWEEFTLREPSLSLLSSLCHPNPIALLPPSPVSFDLITWNFTLWPLPSTCGPPLCPETLLSHVFSGHSTVPVNMGLFPFL